MVFAVIILAVMTLICMILALSLNLKGESRIAVVSMVAGAVFLIFTVSIALSPSFIFYVKSNVFSKNSFEYSYNMENGSLPLPENSTYEKLFDAEANVFITKAHTKEIESFYEGIAEDESFVSIKTDGVHRISLKYDGKYFLIKVSSYDKDYRKLVIELGK